MCKEYVFAEKLENGAKAKYRRKMKAVCLGELDNRNKCAEY